MRNISIQDFEQHTGDFLSEVEAGSHLTLLRGGKAVATIAPLEQRLPLPNGPERDAVISELLEMLHKGWDLKGFRVNRTELYEDAI